MRRTSFPAFICAILFSASSFAKVDLDIQGLDGALESNVQAYLSSISPDDYSVKLRFQSQLEQKITEALNALGYYHPDISFSVPEGEEKLIVQVIPGEVTKLVKVDIQITGEAEHDKDFIQLVAQSGLKVGEPLNHGKYDSLKSALGNLALKKGYFNGKFTQNQIGVSPELNEAMVTLHFDSGIRYQFGETTITGSQIEMDRVASLQPYKQGDSYDVSDVARFNQALSNTEWFSSVLVEPDLSHIDTERQLPMKVTLAPQSRNQLETGLGYSTDVGIKGTLTWKKPWVNEQGHSFDSSFSISEPEQVITLGYKIPLEDVLHQYYRFSYGMKHVDSRDTQSLESNLAIERHWLMDDGWHRTIFARYLIENYEQGELDDIGQFVLPGVTYTRTRTRAKGTLLTWGDKETITLEYGDPSFFSETQVLRVLAGTSWIRSYGENHRGIIRLDGGANLVQNFDRISPSLRFFAGGDNSIRGYGYESISPTDSSGALAGAKYIATGSLEYQYRITGNWWGAVFVDSGDAFDTLPDWKTGTGFGIRWISPVGPLRLDFAWGLQQDPGDQFRIHFTLGPEL
ncbi:autotransporter assembly complex protein TamA [Vibrio porteresiae]|uniref:Translocation and assembly module subunit TamA n=1 Tax=Vibrio porteresiae DSM 19223 TaxID=1123496 RepID=A0ABZ0QBF5_9VIBR|nr:autotransporter assembly complex family protein [Vibrio porteresiae]WPC73797.1 autotransporter assembly complex family protein [Vibrio porteresiae DSM 19223]